MEIYHFDIVGEMKLVPLHTDWEYIGMDWVAAWPPQMSDESR